MFPSNVACKLHSFAGGTILHINIFNYGHKIISCHAAIALIVDRYCPDFIAFKKVRLKSAIFLKNQHQALTLTLNKFFAVHDTWYSVLSQSNSKRLRVLVKNGPKGTESEQD